MEKLFCFFTFLCFCFLSFADYKISLGKTTDEHTMKAGGYEYFSLLLPTNFIENSSHIIFVTNGVGEEFSDPDIYLSLVISNI